MTRAPLVLLMFAAAPAAAQAPVSLTLGEAARLAAGQGATATVARFRAAEVGARVGQSRAALLPAVTLSAADGKRTFNTASFGFSLPGLDPDGEIIGPVRTIDLRGRVAANVLDPAAIGRYRTARAAAAAAGTDATAAARQLAYGTIERQLAGQASVIGFGKVYVLSGLVLLATMPLLFLVRRGRTGPRVSLLAE